ncbi:MAG TPA: hypothetical protein VE642_07930 [Pyrinomonadaceae bacterium]|nr:hypothetical protein [Pyrinomonadaceae bacterium]
MAQTDDTAQDELTRRRRAAEFLVWGAFALIGLLFLIVFIPKYFAPLRPAKFSDLVAEVLGDPAKAPSYSQTTIVILWIIILFLALCSIAYRRAKFNPMRLQDIAALRGLSGLLTTLQRTTVAIALVGVAVAVIGFVITRMTEDWYDMLRAAAIALVVVGYAYPRRRAWEQVARAAAREDADPVQAAKGTIA